MSENSILLSSNPRESHPAHLFKGEPDLKSPFSRGIYPAKTKQLDFSDIL
jgi:hypothetical protein